MPIKVSSLSLEHWGKVEMTENTERDNQVWNTYKVVLIFRMVLVVKIHYGFLHVLPGNIFETGNSGVELASSSPHFVLRKCYV